MIHRQIIITGKVQGVNFRSSAREKAIELGILGTVTNADDGSVYVEAEEPDSEINQYIDWCSKGPENAEVENVEVKEADIVGYPNFEVVYEQP